MVPGYLGNGVNHFENGSEAFRKWPTTISGMVSNHLGRTPVPLQEGGRASGRGSPDRYERLFAPLEQVFGTSRGRWTNREQRFLGPAGSARYLPRKVMESEERVLGPATSCLRPSRKATALDESVVVLAGRCSRSPEHGHRPPRQVSVLPGRIESPARRVHGATCLSLTLRGGGTMRRGEARYVTRWGGSRVKKDR
jgi:hypothetical protein